MGIFIIWTMIHSPKGPLIKLCLVVTILITLKKGRWAKSIVTWFLSSSPKISQKITAIFLTSHLAASRSTLSHWQGCSLTYSMFINHCACLLWPKGQSKPCNIVGSKAQSSTSMRFELGAFRFRHFIDTLPNFQFAFRTQSKR